MNPRAGAPECTPQMPPPARSATTLRQTAPEATRGTSARPRAEAKSPNQPQVGCRWPSASGRRGVHPNYAPDPWLVESRLSSSTWKNRAPR